MSEKILREFQTNFWRESINLHKKPIINYEMESDTVILFFDVPGDSPIVTHYLDQNVALLFRPNDYEIVGLSIEGVERSFAPKYNGINSWQLSKTGVSLKDIAEFSFCVHFREETNNSMPIVINNCIQVEPEVAFINR